MKRPRGLRILVVTVPVAVAAVMATVVLLGGETAAQPRPGPGDALATATAAGPGAAAIVNGAVIPLSRVKVTQAFSQVLGGPAEASLGTVQGALKEMVDNELLYQEAARRGLEPPEAEVHRFVTEQKAALERLLADPTADPKLKQLQESLKGTGFDVASYDTNPDVAAVFRRSLAVNALRLQIRAEFPADQRTQANTDAAVAKLADELRAKGDVRILVPSP
ncbi:MAG: hypothetical protein IT304_08120 [Dehalococcoidia bacterium]|nr:hypothetical protein [Dehalococcoidia bacterium]